MSENIYNFSTFRPKCTRYNPPGAHGSYVSRFTSHTSHMKLIIRLRKDASLTNTAFLMCAVLLDFMAYISYVISKQLHNSETMIDVSIIRVRVRVWKEVSWAANFVDNAIVPDLGANYHASICTTSSCQAHGIHHRSHSRL